MPVTVVNWFSVASGTVPACSGHQLVCRRYSNLDQRLAKAAPTAERISADYQQASALAELLLPYLPPARVAQVRAAQAIVVQALQAAHVATSPAEQRATI